MSLDTLSKAIGNIIDLSVGDIISKFNGDKRAIALAAQKGEIDPTKAVMAGMAVDRVVASAAQPQNTTVAEDALPGGLMAAQGFTDPTAQQAPQMGRPAMPPQMPQRQGLNQVPVPQRGFAGGGIIGFQAGGSSASLMAALDRVLSQMKAADPALNTDYVKQSVLKAPPEQQQQLLSELMNRVSLDSTPTVTPSFSQALAQRDVDPRVMGAMQRAQGLRPDEMMQTESGARVVGKGLPAAMPQTDTGAQYGARPIPGSQILAQKADAAGNIYARPAPPMTTDVSDMPGTFAPYEDVISELGQGVPEPVDPFSATQGRTSIRGGQTDPAEISADKTPSAAMTKKDKELEELAKQREQIEDAGEKEPERRGGKSTIDLALDTLEAKPKDESVTDLSGIEQLKKINEAFGVNANFFKEQAASIKEQADNLKADKKEAANLRLIEAGLRIMGGESPYAAVNIGKGASEAMKGYAKDLQEIKRSQREFDKATRDLALAQQQQARADSRVSFTELNNMARHKEDKAAALATAKANIYMKTAELEAAQKRTETTAAAQIKSAETLRPANVITANTKAVEQVTEEFTMDPQMRKLKKENPAEYRRKFDAEVARRSSTLTGQGTPQLKISPDVQKLLNLPQYQ